MPRYEPAYNQFIVPEPGTVAAAPPKPKRSSLQNGPNIPNPRCVHKKKNSISALERLSVFAEATQRVKRRLRNVIAGAVGASASQPRRKKTRDAMKVDYVWNGYFEPNGFPIGVPFDYPVISDLPNYAPVINRYSVNMEERSISDVSMYFSEAESAPTPRANTPEPSTPIATPKKTVRKEVQATKEDEGSDEEEDGSDEEESREDEKKSGHSRKDASADEEHEKEDKEAKDTSKVSDDAVSILIPMDEDPVEDAPATPKASSPSVPVIKAPIPPKRRARSGTTDSARTLTGDTTPVVKSSTKNPKLTLQTNLIRTPIRTEVKVLTAVIDPRITDSPAGLGLDLEAELYKFKELDLMDIIPPSAVPVEAAPFNSHSANVPPLKSKLLPAVELTDKKPTRRSSRDSDTTIVGSPKRTYFDDEKSDEQSRGLATPRTLRAKIDALPLEQDDSMPIIDTPTIRFWSASPPPMRGSEDSLLSLHYFRR